MSPVSHVPLETVSCLSFKCPHVLSWHTWLCTLLFAIFGLEVGILGTKSPKYKFNPQIEYQTKSAHIQKIRRAELLVMHWFCSGIEVHKTGFSTSFLNFLEHKSD